MLLTYPQIPLQQYLTVPHRCTQVPGSLAMCTQASPHGGELPKSVDDIKDEEHQSRVLQKDNLDLGMDLVNPIH